MISFALIARNAEDTLPVCLRSIKPVADEIVLVDTGSSDGTIGVAESFGAKIGRYLPQDHPDDFLWIPDEKGGKELSLANFAAARNLSFAMAKYPWIFWLDSDDSLAGLAHWWEMLRQFEAERMDGIVLPYEYAFDDRGKCITLLWRERLVRWQPTWQWEGPVHETLPPTARRLAMFDGVRVIHHKDKRRHPILRRRNLEILKAKAPPDDPRTLFYLGTEHTFVGEYKEAVAAFRRYLTVAKDEEETYQALFYLGDLFRVSGQWQEAIDHYQRAILVRPTWRVAYFGLAAAFGHIQDWDRCLYYIDQGRRQPEHSGTLLAHNPKHEQLGWAEWAVNAYRAKGDLHRALQACLDGLKEDPNNPTLRAAQAEFSAKWNEAEGARAIAETAEYLVRKDRGADAAHLLRLCGKPAGPITDLIETTERHAGLGLLPGRAPLFTRLHQAELDPRLVWIVDALRDHPRYERIAFPGSGSSIFARSLCFEFRHQIEAWDPDPSIVSALAQIHEVGAWRGKFHLDHRPLLSAPTGPVDVVVLADVLEYCLDPYLIVETAKTWLRPGGQVLIAVPNSISPNAGPAPSTRNVRLRRFIPDELRRVCRTDHLPILVPKPGGPGWLCLGAEAIDEARIAPRTIGIACAPAPEVWGPHSLAAGIGGSEEAVIRLSRALATRGHRVLIYGDWTGMDEGPDYAVEYRGFGAMEKRHDILVAWRVPELFAGRRLPDAEWLWLWLHDTIDEARLLPVADHLDAILVGSNFHASLYPKLSHLTRVQRYGVDPIQFTNGHGRRNAQKFVWTSCPTRGLETLLDLWPSIREKLTSAELHIFYDFVNFDILRRQAQGEEAERLEALRDRIRSKAEQPGVQWRGRVGQAEIAEEMLSAGVFAYPTNFPEIMCMSAAKAQVAGCWPVFYPLAALSETIAWGWQSTAENFVEHCIAAATGGKPESERQKMQSWATEVYSWERVVLGWEKLMRGL
jgi:glycosyltransferase involved in cell wall biosynthesis/SAM-dependent methyltransferase